MSSSSMLTEGVGDFCRLCSAIKIPPAELKGFLISLDTSERNKSNGVRRSRSRNDVFTDEGKFGDMRPGDDVLAAELNGSGGEG